MSLELASRETTSWDDSATLRSLLDATPDAAVAFDLEGRVLTWNSSASRLYDISATEALGRPHPAVAEDDHAAWMHLLSQIANGETVTRCVVPRQTRQGRRLTLEGSVIPLRDDTGQIIGGLEMLIEPVSRERELLRAVLDGTDDAVFIKDLTGRYLLVNEAAARRLGRTVDAILDHRDDDLFPAEVADCFRQTDQSILARGEPQTFELPMLTPDGERIVLVAKGPFRDRQGAIVGVVCISRDITDRRLAEERLRETQRLESLGVLAGGVAHDFNNLLTAVLGNTELAMALLPSGSSAAPLLQRVGQAARRAAELCRQLLAYAGKTPLVMEPIDLSTLARETADLLRLSISKKITLHFDFSSQLPTVRADATQLRQVLMNLVINASEALNDQPGSITVRTHAMALTAGDFVDLSGGDAMQPGDYVVLEVHDTGCGMDEATRSRIFEPFFTTKFTGRGLGLAAVLGIVLGHKGGLRVRSQPGQGTMFQVMLPASQEPLVRPSMNGASNWRGRGRVLVADDEATVREVAARMLESLGFDVDLVGDGYEVLDRLTLPNANYVLLLLDWTMPRLDGEQTLRELRSRHPCLPVVVMSGYSSQELTTRLAPDPAVGFLSKPFNRADLMDRLRALLN